MASPSKTSSKAKSKTQPKPPNKAAARRASAKSGSAKSGSAKSGSTRSASVRPRRKASRNGFHPGTYTVPRGHVSIAVPAFWYLHQTNDDIQVESEASETTVIVSAYQRKQGIGPLDARDYLRHFLDTAPVHGRLQAGGGSRRDASARFRDPEGDNWLVRFLSNGDTLLLATCHSNRPLNSREGKTGAAVLASVKLKARR
jgi:hypothetical protein